MVVAEVLHCLRRSLGELGAAVANVDTPKAGAEVDEIAALLVPDTSAAAVGYDKRPVLEVVRDRGRGVDQALLVHLLEGEVACHLSHCVFSSAGLQSQDHYAPSPALRTISVGGPSPAISSCSRSGCIARPIGLDMPIYPIRYRPTDVPRRRQSACASQPCNAPADPQAIIATGARSPAPLP